MRKVGEESHVRAVRVRLPCLVRLPCRAGFRRERARGRQEGRPAAKQADGGLVRFFSTGQLDAKKIDVVLSIFTCYCLSCVRV